MANQTIVRATCDHCGGLASMTNPLFRFPEGATVQTNSEERKPHDIGNQDCCLSCLAVKVGFVVPTRVVEKIVRDDRIVYERSSGRTGPSGRPLQVNSDPQVVAPILVRASSWA